MLVVTSILVSTNITVGARLTTKERIREKLITFRSILGDEEVASIKSKVNSIDNMTNGSLGRYENLKNRTIIAFETISLLFKHRLLAYYGIVLSTIWIILPLTIILHINDGVDTFTLFKLVLRDLIDSYSGARDMVHSTFNH